MGAVPPPPSQIYAKDDTGAKGVTQYQPTATELADVDIRGFTQEKLNAFFETNIPVEFGKKRRFALGDITKLLPPTITVLVPQETYSMIDVYKPTNRKKNKLGPPLNLKKRTNLKLAPNLVPELANIQLTNTAPSEGENDDQEKKQIQQRIEEYFRELAHEGEFIHDILDFESKYLGWITKEDSKYKSTDEQRIVRSSMKLLFQFIFSGATINDANSYYQHITIGYTKLMPKQKLPCNTDIRADFVRTLKYRIETLSQEILEQAKGLGFIPPSEDKLRQEIFTQAKGNLFLHSSVNALKEFEAFVKYVEGDKEAWCMVYGDVAPMTVTVSEKALEQGIKQGVTDQQAELLLRLFRTFVQTTKESRTRDFAYPTFLGMMKNFSKIPDDGERQQGQEVFSALVDHLDMMISPNAQAYLDDMKRHILLLQELLLFVVRAVKSDNVGVSDETLGKMITELDEKFGGNPQIQGIKDVLKSVQSGTKEEQKAELKKVIEELQGTIATLNAEIAKLKGELTTATSQITDQAALQTQLGEVVAAKQGLDTLLTKIRGELGITEGEDIVAKIKELKAQLATIQAAHAAELTALQATQATEIAAKNEELSKKEKEKQDEIAKLQKKLDEAEAALRVKTTELEAAQASLAAEKAALVAATTAAETLRASASEENKNLADAKGKAAAAEATAAAAQRKEAEAREAVTALEGKLGEATAAIEALKGEHAAAITTLKEEHTAAIAVLKREHEAVIANKNAEITSLTAEKEAEVAKAAGDARTQAEGAAAAAIAAAEERVAALEAELEAARAAGGEGTAAAAAAQAEVAKMKRELEVARAAVAAAEAAQKAANARLKAELGEGGTIPALAKAEEARKTLQTEIGVLKDEKTKELSAKTAEIEAATAKAKAAEEALAALQRTKNTNAAQITELQQQLEAAQAAATAAAAKAEAAVAQKEAALAALRTNKNAEKANLQQQLEQAQAEKTAAEASVTQKEAELAAAKRNKNTNAAEKAGLQQQLAAAQAAAAQKEEELAATRAEITAAREEFNKLMSTKTAAEAAEIARLKAELAALQARLTAAEEALARPSFTQKNINAATQAGKEAAKQEALAAAAEALRKQSNEILRLQAQLAALQAGAAAAAPSAGAASIGLMTPQGPLGQVTQVTSKPSGATASASSAAGATGSTKSIYQAAVDAVQPPGIVSHSSTSSEAATSPPATAAGAAAAAATGPGTRFGVMRQPGMASGAAASPEETAVPPILSSIMKITGEEDIAKIIYLAMIGDRYLTPEENKIISQSLTSDQIQSIQVIIGNKFKVYFSLQGIKSTRKSDTKTAATSGRSGTQPSFRFGDNTIESAGKGSTKASGYTGEGGGKNQNQSICESLLAALLFKADQIAEADDPEFEVEALVDKAGATLDDLGQCPLVLDLLMRLLKETPQYISPLRALKQGLTFHKTQLDDETQAQLDMLEDSYNKRFNSTEKKILTQLSPPLTLYARVPEQYQELLGSQPYVLEENDMDLDDDEIPLHGLDDDIVLTEQEQEMLENTGHGGIPLGALMFLYTLCLKDVLSREEHPTLNSKCRLLTPQRTVERAKTPKVSRTRTPKLRKSTQKKTQKGKQSV